MEFHEFQTKCIATHNPNQRRGQYAMNLLYDYKPEMYHHITGTAIDPFHQDRLLPAFWSEVARLWDKEPDDYDHPVLV